MLLTFTQRESPTLDLASSYKLQKTESMWPRNTGWSENREGRKRGISKQPGEQTHHGVQQDITKIKTVGL